MRRSLFLSALLHVVLLLGGLFRFAHPHKPELKQQQPLPVEIVASAEITSLKAGATDSRQTAPAASQNERKAEHKAEHKAEPAQAGAARSAPPPAAAPRETPAAQAKVEAAAPARATPHRAEAAPGAEPAKARPAEAKRPAKPAAAPPAPLNRDPPRRFDPDRIAGLIHESGAAPDRGDADRSEPKASHRPRSAGESRFDPAKVAALLNRIPDAPRPPPDAPRPEERRPRQPWRPAGSLDDQARDGEDGGPAAFPPQPYPPRPHGPPQPPRGDERGAGLRMSVNEIDAFRSQISRCWSPPAGGLGDQTVIVRLRIELNPDGSLARPPQVMNAGAPPFFQAAAESAVRAVFACQPYAMPPGKYDQWRDMVLNFDPRQMYGG